MVWMEVYLFVTSVHRMEYIWKCNILLMKTVYILIQILQPGCDVALAKNLAIYIV